MKSLIGLLLMALPMLATAEDYQSTLLVQTGTLKESDLIVRTVTDLESNRICLAFYVRTTGTSPSMSCYDIRSGFKSKVSQTGHFKKGKLVVRKLTDSVNHVACLVAYVSSEGTSPAIHCYLTSPAAKNDIVRSGRLREGDLEVERVLEANSTTTCLIAYVSVGSANPALTCYENRSGNTKGGLSQQGYMREGDLVVRKVLDEASAKECMVSYVSTEGTSPYIQCFDAKTVAMAPAPAKPGKAPVPSKEGSWKPKAIGE